MLIKFLKNVNLDGVNYTTASKEKSVTAEVGAALIGSGSAVEVVDYVGYDSTNLLYVVDNEAMEGRGPLKVGPRLPATLVKDIEVTGDVAPTNATKALDSTNFKTGAAAVRVTGTTAGTRADIQVAITGTGDVWGIWMYVHDYAAINYLQINLGHGADYVNSIQFPNYYPKYNGWHYIQAANNGGVDTNAFTYTGSGSTATQVDRMRIFAYVNAGGIADYTLDSVYAGGRSLTDVMIIIDDGESTGITQSAFTAPADYCAGLGIPLSLAIFGSAIGATEAINYTATYATLGMLRRAYNQGHELVVHGTTSYLTLGDYATVYADIMANKNFLINNGFTRGKDMLVYPIGAYGDQAYIEQAVNDAGMLMARDVYRLSAIPNSLTKTEEYFKHIYIVGHDYTQDTVAEIKARIDGAIAAGMHVCLMFHKFKVTGASLATECPIADFWEIADYIKTKQDAGLCQTVTMSEFYNRRLG